MIVPRVQLLLAAASLLVAGCGSGGVNPSFDLSPARAEVELEAMQGNPKPLTRPVVVIDGYLGTGLSASAMAGNLRQAMQPPAPIIAVNLFWCTDFDDCRRKVVSDVEAAFPSDDPDETVEVDVVGISMGGLAARYAAAKPDRAPVATDDGIEGGSDQPSTSEADAPPKRLKIATLFTLASPHRGAVAASLPVLPPIPTDMREGSAFLQRLNADLDRVDYSIVAYGRLGDSVVGVEQSAPPGQTPIWVPVGPLQASHNGIAMDPRITADIARRLRGEKPFAREPRAPLPTSGGNARKPTDMSAHGRPAAAGL